MQNEERMDKAYWLKLQRKRCGLTQKELARLSGISLRAVQSYEQGTRSLSGASVELVQALCRVLECSEAEILSYPGNRSSLFASCTDKQLCRIYAQPEAVSDVLGEKEQEAYRNMTKTERTRLLTEEMAGRLYRLYTQKS